MGWGGRRRIWGERTEKEFEMTDQEFEKGLAELMAEDGTGKKKGKKKSGKLKGWKNWSRRFPGRGTK